jgi:hypothetical protein
MNQPTDHDELFARVCDGRASADEIATLNRLLHGSPATLDAWLRYSSLHEELAAGSAFASTRAESESRLPPVQFTPPPPRRWSTWLPQAAAGLVAGLCAASVVWAYVLPSASRPHSLLEESFEQPETPLAVRSALEAGTWRGDAAEIVGAEQGVRPELGRHMLRFLRADFDGKPKPGGGHIATAFRLIDLRPLRGEIADGTAVVEATAAFNAAEFPESESYGFAISLFALDADSVPEHAGRLGSTLTNEALAMSRSGRTQLDRDPATWQRVTSELRLPPNAEFLVVRLHINQLTGSATGNIFTGSYVDDVHVTLSHRPPLP